jgi:putative DNA primase/helicase
LDEISQIEQRDAINAIYLLMNGASKNRANVDGSARRGSAWTITLLSSGELSLGEHAEKRTKGGAEIRLLDIEADAGTGLGLFEDLHGTKDEEGDPPGKAFSNRLRSAARTYYGNAMREFIKQLCEIDPDVRVEVIRDYQRIFVTTCSLEGATPEVGRAMQAMALIAAAGELASLWGITGWEEGEANKGVKTCLGCWIAARGGSKTTHDEEQGVGVVRRCIEQSGNSRFEPMGAARATLVPDKESDPSGDDRLVHNRLGFKRRTSAGETEFLFLPEVFKAEVCAGFDYRMVLKALDARGLLKREEPALTLKTRLPGLGSTRVYCVSGAIIEGGGE